MSKIEELIKKHCPNGVEYVKLGEIFDLYKGMTGVSAKWAEQGNCVFIDYLNAYNNLKIDVSLLKNATVKNLKQNIVEKGDILLTCASETPNECAMSSVVEGDIQGDVFLDDHLFGLKLKSEYSDKLNTTFVNYYFRASEFRTSVNKAVRGVTRFYICNADFLKLSIPLPPLPVQEEIVRILDNFTTLEAELDCRKRQYEYYRDKLLNVDCRMQNVDCRMKNVEWKKLGEIGTFTRGRRFVHADDRDEGIPCIHYGELYTHYGVWADKVKTHINPELTTNFRYADKNDVIIVAAGENNVDIGIGVAWLGNEKVAVHDACFIFKHNQNPKFISYALRTYDYHKQIKSKVSQGKICSISADGLANAEIPLPPIAVQERIVNVLDNFEQLCNDLGIGLPAEIEARKQQYEYYRNKLLSFTPPQQLIDYQFIIFGIKINDYIKIMQYVFGYVYVPMSEIAEIKRGVRVVKNDLTATGLFPVFQNCLTPLGYKEDRNRKGEMTFVIVGGAAGSIGYSFSDFWAADDCVTIDGNSEIINRYIYHFLLTQQQYLLSQVRKSSVPRLSRAVIENVKIPLPPLSEQERIVSILDRFDTLVNDISQGLPAEIAARKKQYEYYRDKLLTFRECRM